MGRIRASLWAIKTQVRAQVPSELWSFLAYPIQPIRRVQFREIDVGKLIYRRESKYFIIRRRPPGAGLLSNVNHVIQGLVRAKELGLVPIVDMERYPNSYSQINGVFGKKNAWEYFFNPVSNVSLNEANHSKLYVYSAGERILQSHWLSDKSQSFIVNTHKLTYLNDIVNEHISLAEWCLVLKARIKDFLSWSPEETLGVFLRHDHLTNKPLYHPRQPEIESLIEATENKLRTGSFRYLFVATENKDFRNYLATRLKIETKSDFTDPIFLREIVAKDTFNLGEIPIPVLKLAGYLVQTYLFSEVKTCVSSIANGSTFSFILNGGKYENPTIFNLGVY
jgi:hypothetical protein